MAYRVLIPAAAALHRSAGCSGGRRLLVELLSSLQRVTANCAVISIPTKASCAAPSSSIAVNDDDIRYLEREATKLKAATSSASSLGRRPGAPVATDRCPS